MSLPVHPLTGKQALGFTKRGPIWPVMGGSEDADPPEGAPEGAPDNDDDMAPAAKDWWQFQSKEDAVAWANDKIQKRLGREKGKMNDLVTERDTLKAEVEELRPLKKANETDAERWEKEKASFAEELETLRTFKSKAERNDLVREIADEKGLPPRLVKWVAGDDSDSITQSVDDLLNDLSEVGQSPKKPAQRKPKESDGDKPGDKGFSGGGSGEDDDFSFEKLLSKVREQRGATYAH